MNLETMLDSIDARQSDEVVFNAMLKGKQVLSQEWKVDLDDGMSFVLCCVVLCCVVSRCLVYISC
jgi:hypothetical protein